MSVVPEQQRILHGAIASDDVRLLQDALTTAGLKPGPVDGIYGYRTAAAVRRFQKQQGLDADGIVGPGTWERLAHEEHGEPLRARTLRGLLHGATSGEDVVQAQRALADAGFDPGETDGVYGPQTAQAVLGFQETNGLTADGIVGTTTWSALLRPRTEPDTVAGSPEFVLVWSNADRQAVQPVEEAASTFGHPWESHAVEGLEPGVFESWLDRVVVVLLSPALLSSAAAGVLTDSSRAELRIVPVLLTSVDLTDTPWAEHEVLPADGAALSEAPNPVATFHELLTPFLGPPPPAAVLPGYATDATDGVALFGIAERVEFLASVLAASNLETPLAIGLFGDWGSGKSFFMQRLQERIRLLAEHSAQAAERSEPTLYCSNVRQVTFNAWLYADGDIWPSFAAQVFRSVTGAARDVRPAAAQAEHLADYQHELQSLEERRSQAERDEAELEQRLTEIDAEIEQKQNEIVARAGELAPEAGTAAKLFADLGEALRRLSRLIRDWRSVRPSDALVLVVPVAVAVAAVFFDWARILAALAVIAGILTLLVSSLRYVERTKLLRTRVTELHGERAALERELQGRKIKREAAEANLGEAAQLPLLPEFAEEQAARWLGRQRLGVVTEIRLAFERLSEMIDRSRAAADGGEGPETTLPIDRVIIYVDDLDRCPHDVVVRVLETIKVLLDLRHFVVVVGVDSRWLFRSIQVHFSELLQAEDSADPDAAWAATPQNYLEKIFQYSIVLRPLEQSGFAELIDTLLPVDGTGGDEPQAGRPETLAAGSEDHADAADEVETGTDEQREADAEPEPAATTQSEAPAVDLIPGSLVVTREEVDFMKQLGPLFATPRAAKRLANVYRLLRVSAGAPRLTYSDGYEPVLMLLSIGIAYPGLAGEVFQAMRQSPSASFAELLDDLPPPSERTRSPAEMAQWDRLLRSLTAISESGLADRLLYGFAEWIPVVAEFSFHPWQELLPAETRS